MGFFPGTYPVKWLVETRPRTLRNTHYSKWRRQPAKILGMILDQPAYLYLHFPRVDKDQGTTSRFERISISHVHIVVSMLVRKGWIERPLSRNVHLCHSVVFEAKSLKKRIFFAQIVRVGVYLRLIRCAHGDFWAIFSTKQLLFGPISQEVKTLGHPVMTLHLGKTNWFLNSLVSSPVCFSGCKSDEQPTTSMFRRDQENAHFCKIQPKIIL